MTTVKAPIDGGAYDAIDCGDGWSIVKNVPILALVKKGEKNAPEDIGAEWFSDAAKFHNEAYTKGKIAFPVHRNHHDDQGITHPEFLGYFRPSNVGELDLPARGKTPVLFSNLKLKTSVVEQMGKGELPYLSPEIRNWSKRRVSSIALMDSTPPHNHFPNLTIGKITKDESAKFEAELPEGLKLIKFSEGREHIAFGEFDPNDTGTQTKTEQMEAKCCEHCGKYGEQLGKISKVLKMSEDAVADNLKNRPNGDPVEDPKATPSAAPNGTKMAEELSPGMAAKFAAIEEKNAALERRLNERDAKETAASLATKAIDGLKGYQLTEKTKEYIVKFAEQGEAKLNEFVEALKPSLFKDSARTFAQAEAVQAVNANDPVVAKFAAKGPDVAEKAIKFAQEYRTLKATPAGSSMRLSEEQFVSFRMDDRPSKN